MKLTGFVFVGLLTIFLSSCDKDSDDGGKTSKPIGGDKTEFVDVGKVFTPSNAPDFFGSPSLEITSEEDNVYSVTLSSELTDEQKSELATIFPTRYVDQNSISGKYRITSEGVQSVYDNGTSFTWVKFDAKVGDKYTYEKDGKMITREVIQRSSKDDYNYGFYLIKTIAVEETGRNIAGCDKVVIYFNHKFGPVGYYLYFEDGSTYETVVF